ncbi:ADP-ribosylation factor-binding protein GGA2 [Gracilinanus agilis]|uniref:ADP-ribosylation factor-binding protein GGA2 n=1 Tax=Gracilinanus agilis TaxID=191870 RepID=UPI001CFC9AA3|nr:ADP-ribosylation factor-binding protein GGA2 [Gracilinanus agilis]
MDAQRLLMNHLFGNCYWGFGAETSFQQEVSGINIADTPHISNWLVELLKPKIHHQSSHLTKGEKVKQNYLGTKNEFDSFCNRSKPNVTYLSNKKRNHTSFSVDLVLTKTLRNLEAKASLEAVRRTLAPGLEGPGPGPGRGAGWGGEEEEEGIPGLGGRFTCLGPRPVTRCPPRGCRVTKFLKTLGRRRLHLTKSGKAARWRRPPSQGQSPRGWQRWNCGLVSTARLRELLEGTPFFPAPAPSACPARCLRTSLRAPDARGLCPPDKATDPSMPEENWSCIQCFCDQVNSDPDGISHAPWLLAHKIQSPQEMEALHALTVLEVCMNYCGEKFHSEVAKFRFLNELIKVLSPKYLGCWTTEKVKSRIIEIMFSWTVWFPKDIKIRDAYQMLKKQGIIKQDPKLPVDKILPPPSPRPKSSIFDADEEKSKLLTKLLKSNHPEDLQAANRLIKTLIKEEQEKSEKVSKRLSTIQEVHSSVKLMKEMLNNHQGPNLEQLDLKTLQGLYEKCEKLRPTLFRLASDTVDDDVALAEILQANDRLSQGVLLYKQVVEGQGSCGNMVASTVTSSTHGDLPASQALQAKAGSVKSYSLIDFSDLDSESGPQQGEPTSLSLLDEQLATLGLSDAPVTCKTSSDFDALQVATENGCQEEGNFFSTTAQKHLPGRTAQTNGTQGSSQEKLLGLSAPQTSFIPDLSSTLNLLHQKTLSKDSPVGTNSFPEQSWEIRTGDTPSQPALLNQSLSQLFVPLESIKPSDLPPITVYDRNGFKVLLHFSQAGVPGFPEVQVLLLSMLSTAPQPVSDIVFQVAVPKAMKVKLQPASSSKLPAFSPLLPPTVISQVLLLANPHKDLVRLRYKLTFTQGGKPFSEVGEVSDFPDPALWSTV